MMHKLPDLSDLGGYAAFPRIHRSAIRYLWHSAFWDHAQSGVLLYNGERCWFQMIDESEGNDWFRRFLVVRLTDEQMRDECYWHELFREKVGTHTDYDESGKRQVGELKPQEMWHEFYDAYESRQPLDLSRNQVVGWFEV
jgi:hypothetical protein